MSRGGIKAWALALVVTAAVAAPAYRAFAVDDSDLDAKIVAAKTPADHEAIAAYYEGKAADAKAKAAEHKKLSAEYKKSIGTLSKTHFHQHCDSLVSIYSAAAKEFDALAKSHHEMAKHAK